MGTKYTITSGVFVEPDGTRRGAGQIIELDDDVAALHAAILQPVEAPASELPGILPGPAPEAEA